MKAKNLMRIVESGVNELIERAKREPKLVIASLWYENINHLIRCFCQAFQAGFALGVLMCTAVFTAVSGDGKDGDETDAKLEEVEQNGTILIVFAAS